MIAKLKIANEKYFNNGKIIANSLSQLCQNIRNALSQEENLEPRERHTKGKSDYYGIKADSLNQALREKLKFYKINGETHVENGVFFHKSKEGFDFSEYDKEYNMARLYNYYQGSIGILNGDEKIINIYKKVGYSKKEWKGKIQEIHSIVSKDNSDYIVDKELLTVVGELQFGNWALIYRDLFRLLDAESDPGIDFYIYVTADGNLSSLLSANTVSYSSADKVISEYLSIIKTPIWLIGLDLDM